MISGNDGPDTSSAPSDHTSSSMRATRRTPPGSNSSGVSTQGPSEIAKADAASPLGREPFVRCGVHADQSPISV